MRTLSQQTLSNLVFGRIVLIICAQILLFILAINSTRMSLQDMDIATLVNIAAIMSCTAMLNAARKGFSSTHQNVIILLFDSLYLGLLISISGISCSPFIILLPLYIFSSSLSLRTWGTVISTLFSIGLVAMGGFSDSALDCRANNTLVTASIIILFALLAGHMARKGAKKRVPEMDEDETTSQGNNIPLETVVSILAHEIKNPVSSLAGVSELIKSDGNMLNNPEQREKLLGIIERETSRLANLTEEFLVYSGSEKRRNERIEIDALIHICCESVRAHKNFIEKEIELKFHSQNGPHIIYGDFQRLEQVFTNILINSVQACKKNGVISCHISSSGGHINAIITNNGEKIPPHLIDKIFDPFFTTKDKGTGLGLAIAKNIIKAHDGSIEVQSTGSETSFKMRFKSWQ